MRSESRRQKVRRRHQTAKVQFRQLHLDHQGAAGVANITKSATNATVSRAALLQKSASSKSKTRKSKYTNDVDFAPCDQWTSLTGCYDCGRPDAFTEITGYAEPRCLHATGGHYLCLQSPMQLHDVATKHENAIDEMDIFTDDEDWLTHSTQTTTDENIFNSPDARADPWVVRPCTEVRVGGMMASSETGNLVMQDEISHVSPGVMPDLYGIAGSGNDGYRSDFGCMACEEKITRETNDEAVVGPGDRVCSTTAMGFGQGSDVRSPAWTEDGGLAADGVVLVDHHGVPMEDDDVREWEEHVTERAQQTTKLDRFLCPMACDEHDVNCETCNNVRCFSCAGDEYELEVQASPTDPNDLDVDHDRYPYQYSSTCTLKTQTNSTDPNAR